MDRITWYLECLWLFPALIIITVLWFKKIHFTWLLQLAMFLHALILIYGGHYTYEMTPLGEAMKVAFGFTRNHYDRIGHLAQGFFPAIIYRELFVRNNAMKNKFWTECMVFASCMAFAGIFELMEFSAAKAFGSDADYFLGFQGDMWDTQYDILLCGVGTILSMLTLGKLHYKVIKQFKEKKKDNPDS